MNNFRPLNSQFTRIGYLCAVVLGVHHDAELGEVESVVAVAVVLSETRVHVARAQPANDITDSYNSVLRKYYRTRPKGGPQVW